VKVKTARLREDEIAEIEKIANAEGKKVSEVLREVIDMGLKEYRIRKAIDLYQTGKLSQGASAEMAGLTLQEFHRELKKRGFTLRISLESIKNELKDL